MGVVGLTLAVFIAVGIFVEGGFEHAWNVMLGIDAPFGGQAAALAVLLSVLGYIAVPTVIGLAVADGLTRFTRRRLLTTPEAEADIRDMVKDEISQHSTPPAS